MTTKLTIRLPVAFACELKSKAKAERTTASAVLRRAAVKFVLSDRRKKATAMQRHVDAHAGRWDGYCTAEELLRRTRH